MFEKAEKTMEEKRSRAVLWVGTGVILLLTAIIVMMAKSRPQNAPALDNVVRAGAVDFDSYKEKIEIELTDKIVHPNMIGMAQYEVQARFTNRGDRTLTGIELVGKMIDLDDKLLKEGISLPIPRARTEPLKPGESMKVSVKIDAPAKVTEGMIKDLAVELRGLRF